MEISTEEYNDLKALYASKGFGIMIRLLDEQINMNLSGMLSGSASKDSELSATINKMRGLAKARNLIQSILKEEEHKHENS